MSCVNQLVIETKHFDILVLVSKFIVVAIFSEWWSVPTAVGTSLSIDVNC